MNYCFVSRNTIIPYTKSLKLEIYLMSINNFENRRNSNTAQSRHF